MFLNKFEEDIEMNAQQKKVRKFYKDFISWRLDTVGAWLGSGMLVIFLLFLCAVPVQEIFAEPEPVNLLMVLGFSPLAGLLYLRPYQTFVEDKNSVRIADKIKYLPIDAKEIRKMKMIYLVKFFGKILPLGLLLQIVTSMYSYGEITWVNFTYIFAAAFAWPVLLNVLGIYFEKG